MMAKKTLVLVILVGLAGGVQAEPPRILLGHADTKWGQSLDDVKRIVPGGTVRAGDSGNDNSYTVKGKGATVETTYRFVDDQLFLVRIVYELPNKPETGPDMEGFAIIDRMIKQKYQEIQAVLQNEGLHIEAAPRQDGKIYVTYENSKVYVAALNAIQERKRIEQRNAGKEREGTRRFKEIKALGIEDAL